MKFLICAITIGLLTACSGGRLSQTKVSGDVTGNQTSTSSYPVVKITKGGFMMPVPDSERVDFTFLMSDGAIKRVYRDGHSDILTFVSADLMALILSKLSKVHDAYAYELKPDSTAIMCDHYYKYEIFLNGAAITVEEQQNCGSHLVLQYKSGAVLPSYSANDLQLPWVSTSIVNLVKSILVLNN